MLCLRVVVVLAMVCFLCSPGRGDARWMDKSERTVEGVDGKSGKTVTHIAGVGPAEGVLRQGSAPGDNYWIAGRLREAPEQWAQVIDNLEDSRPGAALDGYYRAKQRREMTEEGTEGWAGLIRESGVEGSDGKATHSGVDRDGYHSVKKCKKKEKAEEVSDTGRDRGDVRMEPKPDSKNNKNGIRTGDIFIPTPKGGAVNTRSGQFYPGMRNGIIDSKTGRYMPKVRGGYIDPKTGFHPIRF